MLDTGGKLLLIDATNKLSQVYVDLDEGREMKPSEAFETAVACRRNANRSPVY